MRITIGTLMRLHACRPGATKIWCLAEGVAHDHAVGCASSIGIEFQNGNVGKEKSILQSAGQLASAL